MLLLPPPHKKKGKNIDAISQEFYYYDDYDYDLIAFVKRAPDCLPEIRNIYEARQDHYCILGAFTPTHVLAHIKSSLVQMLSHRRGWSCHFSPFKAIIRTSDQIWFVSHQLTSRPAATPPSPSLPHDCHSQHSLPSSAKFHRSPNTWLCPLFSAHLPQMVTLSPPLSLSYLISPLWPHQSATPSSGCQKCCCYILTAACSVGVRTNPSRAIAGSA